MTGWDNKVGARVTREGALVAKHLPPKRKAVLDFCRAEVAAGRPFPSYAVVAAHMGWKQPNSAKDALDKLHYYDKVLERRQIATGRFEYGFTGILP